MTLNDEAKRDILDCVLNAIGSIADKEYQKRVWIRGEGPECDDFDETRCIIFNEGDSIVENYKNFDITEKQRHVLKTLRDALDGFENNPRHYLPQEFVDTPEWTIITELAQNTLKIFNYKKKSLSARNKYLNKKHFQ